MYFLGKEGESEEKEKYFLWFKWSGGMKVWNYLQQCWRLHSALVVYTGAHSDPPTLSSLSKPRRKITSPHTAAPLAATTEEPGSAIFRFGVGALPKLSSTTRTRAESTETLELYQDSTSLLSTCLLALTLHSASCKLQGTCGFHHLAQRCPFLLLLRSLSCLNFLVSISSRTWSHEFFLLSR